MNWSICYVHLADNEWGNEKMWAAAQEVFAAYPNVENLVVNVYEHAGWFLEYMRDGTICGTANDKAVLSDKARSFIQTLKGRPHFLPEIWRKKIA